MPSIHDVLTKNRLPAKRFLHGHLYTLRDKTRDLWNSTPRGVEPVNGCVTALITGDGSTTSFTIGTIPKDSLVDKVEVVVVGTAGTAATTLAVGYSGTTGAYMAASSFGSTMNAAGAKSVTTVKVHETTSDRTALATFSAAWDSGAKVIVSIHYIPFPPTS